MKTYQFKNALDEFFSGKMAEQYPGLAVFRERLRSQQPDYPFVVLKSGERTRLNKRFESFQQDGKTCVKAQFRLPVTFSVYALSQNAGDAEKFSDEVIDYIEYLFTDCRDTHFLFFVKGIVINELLNSGVRDLSRFSNTNQEFREDIDIVFEFEDVQKFSYELGEKLDIDIRSE